MKITNIHNLPEEIVTAIKNREYSKGDADYSATGLLQPPQLQILTGWNYNNLTTDVSESIWSLFGSAVHYILEVAAKEDEQQLAEKRLYATLGGIKISGMFDRYEKSLFSIDDYKVTSVWKATKGDIKDWTAQLNIYNWLFKSNYPDIPVEKLRVHAILRDWSFREAKKSIQNKHLIGDYPPSQIFTVDIPLWSQFETIKFLVHKLEVLEIVKTVVNASELAKAVPCSNEDRWAKPDSWAIFNQGKNRTQKLFTSNEHMTLEMCEKEARIYVAGMQAPGYKAVIRKGENIRCENFCLVKDFCAQYKGMTTNEVKSEVISVEKAAEELTNE